MRQALVYHPALMQSKTGSSEELLRNVSRILSGSGEFTVWCWYDSENVDPELLEEFKKTPHVQLLPFTCSGFNAWPPGKPRNINPTLHDCLKLIGNFIFISTVSSGDQWPITKLPKRIPLILISPFGDVCSNGNLRCIYVSGDSNYKKLLDLNISSAKLLFNPIVIPPVKLVKEFDDAKTIIFGRVGRSSSYIFDPISILAFAKLEAEFGKKVRYIYVNPSAEAKTLVSKLNLKQVLFLDWLSKDKLNELYDTIDVFAHARHDGETLGVSIAEAMLHGCPIITHRSSVANEHLFLVKEPFGFVTEQDNVQQYYESMRYFVINGNKIPVLGFQAREFASRYFDWSAVSGLILIECINAYEFIGKPLSLSTRVWHKLLVCLFWIHLITRKLSGKFFPSPTFIYKKK